MSTPAGSSSSPPPHVTMSPKYVPARRSPAAIDDPCDLYDTTRPDLTVKWGRRYGLLINTAQRPNSQPWLWLLPTPASRVCMYWLGWLTSAAMLVLRVISHCVHTHTHKDEHVHVHMCIPPAAHHLARSAARSRASRSSSVEQSFPCYNLLAGLHLGNGARGLGGKMLPLTSVHIGT